MKRMVMIGAIVATALAAIVLEASPAGAVPPEQESFHDEFSFDIDCGTFVLHEDVVLDVKTIVLFNQDGDPVAVQEHVRFVGVITNPAGQTFRDPGYFTTLIDLAGTPDDDSDDIIANAGLIFAITVPGQGIVAQDTGIIIFLLESGDVIIHGPHEVFQQGEALLCAALG